MRIFPTVTGYRQAPHHNSAGVRKQKPDSVAQPSPMAARYLVSVEATIPCSFRRYSRSGCQVVPKFAPSFDVFGTPFFFWGGGAILTQFYKFGSSLNMCQNLIIDQTTSVIIR